MAAQWDMQRLAEVTYREEDAVTRRPQGCQPRLHA